MQRGTTRNHALIIVLMQRGTTRNLALIIVLMQRGTTQNHALIIVVDSLPNHPDCFQKLRQN